MEANLARIPADLAGSIVARLQRARSVGAFFDAANAAWKATRRDTPFRGGSKVSDARLVILDSPSAISAEARRMENCLADYKFLPLDGDVAYAAWRGSEPATVELVWGGHRWRLGDVRGRKNAVVSGSGGDHCWAQESRRWPRWKFPILPVEWESRPTSDILGPGRELLTGISVAMIALGNPSALRPAFLRRPVPTGTASLELTDALAVRLIT